MLHLAHILNVLEPLQPLPASHLACIMILKCMQLADSGLSLPANMVPCKGTAINHLVLLCYFHNSEILNFFPPL